MKHPPKISVVLPVLAPTPWHRALTEFCIKSMQLHARYPFELIMCEAGDATFREHPGVNTYLNFNPKIGGVKEINAGVRAATGDFIVVTGNDVIVPPNWDDELLLPFALYEDAGITTLGAKEPGAVIGSPAPMDLIVEGMFSPISMFKKGWEYDEEYLRIYQDSDLVLRMYQKQLRAYRNLRAQVWHMGSVTNTTHNKEWHDAQVGRDEELFYKKWGGCPYAMFGMIRAGHQIYGREYEAWVVPINRH